MGKRRAEKQIDKDTYDADAGDQSDESKEEFPRASAEEIAARKIVKVKRTLASSDPHTSSSASDAPDFPVFNFASDDTKNEDENKQTSNAPPGKRRKVESDADESDKKAPAAAAAPDDIFAKFRVQADEWECSSCFVTNKNTEVKCRACEVVNPNAPSDAKAEAHTESSGISFGFGSTESSEPSFNFGSTDSTFGFGGTESNMTFGSFGDNAEINFGSSDAAPEDPEAPVVEDVPTEPDSRFKDAVAEPSGEQHDTTLYHQICKAYRLQKSEDGGEDKWSELGKGELRINSFKLETKTGGRLIVRMEKTHKLLMNAPVFVGMNHEIEGDKFVKVFSLNEEQKPTAFLIKFGSKAFATEAHDAIAKLIASLK